MKRKRCQAFARSTSACCKKNALRGSRYCWSHQTKGPLLASLILGALLSLLFTVTWDQLTQQKPEFRLYVNNKAIFDKAVVTIPAETVLQEIRLTAWNIGDAAAKGVLGCITYPAELKSLVVADRGSKQRAPHQIKHDDLVEAAQFGHLALSTSDTVPIDKGFTFPQLKIKVPINKPLQISITISVWSLRSEEVTHRIVLYFIPGNGEITVEPFEFEAQQKSDPLSPI